jgi:hypothetical protein
MTGYFKNPWVTFLRQYGPIASNDNMYDEHIESAARRSKVNPLRFDTGGLFEEIVRNFQSDQPRSVVLTGTAGDGKTYLCREVWTRLGGDAKVWDGDAKLRVLDLEFGVQLRVIKDLSELTVDEAQVLAPMAEAMFAHLPRAVYLVAANDGQLRQAWERVTTSEVVVAARKLIERLLVKGVLRAAEAGLRLYNLSRQSSSELMSRVVDAVVAHEGWKGCDGCLGTLPDRATRCPIWENYQRLQNPLLRERLSDLLELCDQSDRHLPVRQLLILASNMLMGHPDAKDDLLRCQDIEAVARKGRTHLGSIYRNAFGENLPESRRESTAVFEVVGRFGVGEETSNRIDNLLVYGHDDPGLTAHFNELFRVDPMYGATEEFSAYLTAYLEGTDPEKAARFAEVATAQRQRLFFTMPAARADELGLWELTVFQFAGEYLEQVLRPLAKPNGYVDDSILKRLVRGLNRVFTGMLTGETERLWLASSGSHSQARVCRIAEHEIPVEPQLGSQVAIEAQQGGAVLAVYLDRDVRLTLPLHLVRYEFLLRVADGALPSNFSRECYEDILSFKSRLLRRWKKLNEAQEQRRRPDTFGLRLLTLHPEGTLVGASIKLRLEERR